MVISGFMNTTLLDYPGHVAATVFTGGCNFRCPFCHNGDIVISPVGKYSDDEVLQYLNKRKNVLDGVCITGGEPTLQRDLPEFICKIKSMGLKVKLDSNGYQPDAIAKLLEGNLLDYVAMDVKAPLEKYGECVGIDDFDTGTITSSIDILMNSGVEYEFRTTFVKGLHVIENMHRIGEMIKGATAYYIQSYKNSEAELGHIMNCDTGFSAFSREELERILAIAGQYCQASLRGID